MKGNIRIKDPLHPCNEWRDHERIQAVFFSLNENRIQCVKEFNEMSHITVISRNSRVNQQCFAQVQQIVENVHALVEHADDHIRIVVYSLKESEASSYTST